MSDIQDHKRLRFRPNGRTLLRSGSGRVGYWIGLERFGDYISRRVLWKAETDDKILALTFDDGPHEIYTPLLLDILGRENAAATFFVIGENVRRYPEITRRIIAEGHLIGNHTFSHSTLTNLSDRAIGDEILRTQQIVAELTDRVTDLVRPPKGLFSRRVLDIAEANSHQVVVGDVYPRDVRRPGTDEIVRRVLRRTDKGSIIILHDGATNGRSERIQTIEAVRKLIPLLKSDGFSLRTISELTA